ncbi:MAG: histidine--tRNA ligase [Xanthomonadales bacterium]|nr:histidine--tRNA ligase [Xanthomonadales bacterium]
MTSIRRVKGMYDIVPEDAARWHWVEGTTLEVLETYGYRELRLPLLEQTDLFARAMGESTDVVSKEMYAFEDRNGDHLALRPEGTAGCVRAVIQNGLLQGHARKLWYGGPMFRRENVQRGRNRQFYQIGAEVFGLEGPDVDAEQLLMLDRLWKRLGLTGLRLEINSLGTAEARARYRETLVDYFEARREALDDDSVRRLEVNPLRILDSKNPAMSEVIAEAPSLLEHLDDASREHFERLRSILDEAGVAYHVNPRLVRGLDYYSRTVFECITDELGAQGTVCAGGRYDGLVEAQGGKPTPALGFAMGIDRLVELTQVQGREAPNEDAAVYLVLAGSGAQRAGLVLAEQLREALPRTRIECNLGGGSFKAQFKRADRSGARYAVVIGEDELAASKATVKPLRSTADQATVPLSELGGWLRDRLAEPPVKT